MESTIFTLESTNLILFIFGAYYLIIKIINENRMFDRTFLNAIFVFTLSSVIIMGILISLASAIIFILSFITSYEFNTIDILYVTYILLFIDVVISLHQLYNKCR